MAHNEDSWNDERNLELELNKKEAFYVKAALEFAAEHDDGWKGREYEGEIKDLAERAETVWTDAFTTLPDA